MKKHISNVIILGLIGVLLPHFFAFIIHAVTPFTYNLDIHKLEYGDICVGTNVQTITTSRAVRPHGLVVQGNSVAWEKNMFGWNKTDITRSFKLPYEDNDSEEFSISIEWDKPFNKLGEYGVSTTVKIKPYLIPKKSQENYREKIFNVIEC